MADVAADVHVVIGTDEVRAGRLWARRYRGRESASFAYDDAYLAYSHAYPLEPALPLVAGQQHTAEGRAMFAGPKLLSTAIDEHSREARIDTAMDVAEYFRMGEADAKRVLGEVVAATEQWRRVAAQRGLDEAAMDQMARAFEHAESERAREILASVESKARRAPHLG